MFIMWRVGLCLLGVEQAYAYQVESRPIFIRWRVGLFIRWILDLCLSGGE